MPRPAKIVPRTVAAATEAIEGTRGQPERLRRVFDLSPVPMVMVDEGHRYVEGNRPGRLALRLSLGELRGYIAEDLTPPHQLPTLEAMWERLRDAGRATGPFEVVGPDGCPLEIVYSGVASVVPGLDLFAFAPAGWPEDELGLADRQRADGPRALLTAREREVLQLGADGLSGAGIAEQLVVSPATVKTHLENIYEKLGVRGRAAAVAEGMRLGLIH